jgi:hypothetical protein
MTTFYLRAAAHKYEQVLLSENGDINYRTAHYGYKKNIKA